MIEVIVAVLSGVLTLVGTILTVFAGMSKQNKQMEIAQAVTNEKIENLREEVKKHNDFGQKIPILELRVSQLEQAVKHE